MGVISKFEGMFEGVVEGSVSRLFRSKLQPAEIQKRLERVMEDTKEVSLGKSFVPNRYEIYLNPEDFEQFAPHKNLHERDMTQHIEKYAQERRFVFGGERPRVWLNPSAEVRRRGFNIRAYTVDPNQPRPATLQQPLAPALDAIPEGTAILNIGAQPLTGENRPIGGGIARPEAMLTVLEYPANHPAKNIRFQRDVTIGRGLDNEIVFNDDSRVSRHHARMEFKYGQFLLTDLNSTNGTSVNGRPITQIVLSPGDRVSLGGLDMIFSVS